MFSKNKLLLIVQNVVNNDFDNDILINYSYSNTIIRVSKFI